tara:strand:+ start:106 stop:327 length:222 start_codon:yes stop_codon:yes gene_type:complete
MANKYSRYCYEDTARILGNCLLDLQNEDSISRCKVVVKDIIHDFGKMYEADNELFDWKRYHKRIAEHEKGDIK